MNLPKPSGSSRGGQPGRPSHLGSAATQRLPKRLTPRLTKGLGRQVIRHSQPRPVNGADAAVAEAAAAVVDDAATD